MQATTMQAGDIAMTNELRQSSLGNALANSKERAVSMAAAMPGSGVGILMAAAGLLTLLGLMAQFGELGLGPFTRGTFWIIPFLANGIWNILMALLSRTALADALTLWPLTLVLAGSAALFLLSSKSSIAVEQESGRGGDYGR
jgi:hypothetical protein